MNTTPNITVILTKLEDMVIGIVTRWARNCWNEKQVTPLYKKDGEFRKINYRPVTVLPTLSIIFESLLSGQMYEFYTGLL